MNIEILRGLFGRSIGLDRLISSASGRLRERSPNKWISTVLEPDLVQVLSHMEQVESPRGGAGGLVEA